MMLNCVNPPQADLSCLVKSTTYIKKALESYRKTSGLKTILKVTLNMCRNLKIPTGISPFKGAEINSGAWTIGIQRNIIILP